MEQAKQQQIFTKYPVLFQEKDLPMRETCMCWGIDLPDAWYELLDKLCDRLDRVTKTTGVTVIAQQVKNKYARLTFYWRPEYPDTMPEEEQRQWYDIIHAIVSHYSNQSGQTCEECGDFGQQTEGGWIHVLCAKHREDR
jgi:hypothetical protein